MHDRPAGLSMTSNASSAWITVSGIGSGPTSTAAMSSASRSSRSPPLSSFLGRTLTPSTVRTPPSIQALSRLRENSGSNAAAV